MDPNKDQPINTNPFAQQASSQPAAPQPITAAPPSTPDPLVQQVTPPAAPISPAQQAAAPAPTPEPVSTSMPPLAPKSGGKKGIILIVILLILALGMAFYVFFVKNQLKTAQKASTENTNIVIPTTTIQPTATPATVDEIEIASPDADLSDIEADIQGL